MSNSKSHRDFYDYLLHLVYYRRLIIANFLFFLIVTYLITLLLPKWYKAEVVLLPPQQDIPFGLSAIASTLPIDPSTLGLTDEETNKYIAILESRSIKNKIVIQKDLMNIYDVQNIEEAIEVLSSKTNVLIGNEGTIQIIVFDKSPQRAADIANLYTYFLDSLYTEYSIQKAHFNRVFFENQLDETKRNLNMVETELQEFQSTYGTIALPEQIEATIKAAGEMIAKKFSLQIELELKEKSLSVTHPDILRLKDEIQAIDTKLHSMEQNDRAIESILLPFNNLPDLGLKYARLLRDVEIQNKVYAILFQQYQQSKIEEAKDTPSVQVLDQAIPPLKRAKPKRVFTTALSAISATILLLISLMIYIHIQFLKEIDYDKYNKIRAFFSHLIGMKSKQNS